MTGHIRKRRTKTGAVKWDLVLDYGRTVEGKRNPKSGGTFPTERAARQKLREYLRDADQGMTRKPDRTPFQTVLDRWLNEEARLKVKDTTFTTYDILAKQHITPVLGNRPTQAITRAELQRWVADLSQRYAASTVRQTFAVARQVFGAAVRWDLLARSRRWVSSSPVSRPMNAPSSTRNRFSPWKPS